MKFQHDIGHEVRFPDSPHISTYHDGRALYHLPSYGIGPHHPVHHDELVHHVEDVHHIYPEHHVTVEPVGYHHRGHGFDGHEFIDHHIPFAEPHPVYDVDTPHSVYHEPHWHP